MRMKLAASAPLTRLARDNVWAILLAGCSFLVFLLTYFSTVSYAGSDPQLSLLASQSILEEGTIRLDAYRGPEYPLFEQWMVQGRNGHYYYYWPIGPSVLSVPFVWVANLLGLDMSIVWQNNWVQKALSAALTALVFIIIYASCRAYLDPLPSLVITAVSVLGSALVSTMGTALWNIDFAVLFVALTLFLLLRFDSGRKGVATPYLLGLLLFLAYFCRPSTSTFIIVVLAYLLLRSRRVFLRTATTALVLLLLFLLFSWVEYGQLSPDYYTLARFQTQKDPVWRALYGHLLSPSRGLLIFSPFFIVVLVGVLVFFGHLKRHWLLWLVLSWFALHIVVTSSATRWWGGHSFGPRVLTEAIPALIVLTVILWHEVSQKASPGARRVLLVSYLALGLFGVFVNSYQGLYNTDTVRWNGTMPPDVGTHREYLLDWRYPQFLVSSRSVCERNLQHVLATSATPAPYVLGETITHMASGEEATFVGWSKPEQDFRWSECTPAKIRVMLGDIDRTEEYAMEIRSGSFGTQEVTVQVNGIHAGKLVFPGPHAPPVARSIIVEGWLLKPRAINEIEFHTPNATVTGSGDARPLGLAFAALRLDVAH